MQKGRFLHWILLGNIFLLLVWGIVFGISCYQEIKLNVKDDFAVEKENIYRKGLIITSYHLSHVWTQNIIHILEQQSATLPCFMDYSVISLNSMNSELQSSVDFLNYELENIIKGQYDLIITIDDVALDSLLNYVEKIPKSTAIVFGGYEKNISDLKEQYPNLTGLKQLYRMSDNIALGIKLFPQTKGVFFISDFSQETQRMVTMLKQQLPTHLEGLPIRYINRFEQMEQNDSFLSNSENLIIVNPWRSLSKRFRTSQSWGLNIFEIIKRPYLVSDDSMFEYGALGGYMTRSVTHGLELASLVKKVLVAKSAVDIPIQNGTVELVLDDRLIKKYQISLNNIPKNAIFINRPPSIFQKYGKWILGTSIFILLLGSAFFILCYRLYQLKRVIHQHDQFIENLPIRIGVIDENEEFIYIHHELQNNLDDRDIKHLSDLKDFEYQEISSIFKNVFATGEPQSFEYKWGEEYRIMQIKLLPYSLYQKKCLIWVSQENKKLVQMRILLNKSNTFLHQILMNLPCYVFVRDRQTQEYLISSTNFSSCMKESDVNTLATLQQVWSEEVCRDIIEKDKLLSIEHPEIESIETYPVKNGSLSLLSKKRLITVDGREYVLGVGVDIRKQQKLESDLQKSVDSLNVLFDTLPAYILVKDVKIKTYIKCNALCSKLFARPLEQILGKTNEELILDKTIVELAEKLDQKTIEEGFDESIIPFKTLEGESHVGKVIRRLMNGDSENPLIMIIVFDITDSENIKNSLHETIDRLSFVYEHNPSLIMFKELKKLSYTHVNETFCKFFNRPKSELIGKTDFELFPNQKDAELLIQKDMCALAEEQGQNDIISVTDITGKKRDYQMFRKIFTMSNGEKQLFITGVEITEIIVNKKLFNHSVNQINLLLEHSQSYIIFLDVDNDYRYLLCNKKVADIIGLPEEQIIGHNHSELFKDRQELQYLWHKLQNIKDLKEPKASIESFTLKNGQIRKGQFYRQLLRDADGKRVLFVQINDITDEEFAKKELENVLVHLRDTHSLWETVLHTVPIHFLICNVSNKSRCVMTNRAFLQFWNLTEKEVHGKSYSDIYPNRKEKTFYNVNLVNETSESPAQESIHQVSDYTGKSHYLDIRQSCFTNSHGDVWSILLAFDVTIKEKAKQELKDSNKMWNTVMDLLPFYFYVKEVNHNYSYLLINHNFEEYVNRPRMEILGKNDFDLFDPKVANEYHQKDLMTQKNHQACTYIDNIVKHQKNEIIRSIKLPFSTSDGRQFILGIGVDITNEVNLVESEQINSKGLRQVVLNYDFNENLNQIVSLLNESVKSDRVIVAKCDEEGQLRFYKEWCSDGIEPYPDRTLFYPIWDQHVVFHKTDEILAFNDFSKSGWTQQDIPLPCSMIIAPIWEENVLWGAIFVEFNKRSRHFSEIDEGIMRTISNLISLAYIRYQQVKIIDHADYEKQIILNSLKIPIWLYDEKGSLLRINTAVYKMLEMTESTVLKKYQDNKWIPEDDIDIPLSNVIKNHQAVQKQVVYKNKNYIVYVTPVFDESGKLINIVKSAIDVTLLNQMILNERMINSCMESLLKEEDFEQSIQVIFSTICTHLKASYCYVLKNDQEMEYAIPIYQYDASNSSNNMIFIPLPLSAQLKSQYVNRTNHLFSLDLKKEESQTLMKSWDPLIKLYDFCSLYDIQWHEKERVSGSFGIIYDKESHSLDEYELNFLNMMIRLFEIVLERNNLHEQFLNALKQAQDANRAKSFFLASVSHEIRTPLNSVIGFSELLQDDSLSRETQKEFLGNIQFSGKALLDLINDVLDLSKLEAKQMVFTLSLFDFKELSNDVMHIFQQRIIEKELYAEIQMDNIPEVYLDRLRMRQILFNLLGNSVKFTNSGFIRLSAQFTILDDHQGTMVFSVEDSGCGISEKDQQSIFCPFVQSDAIRGTYAANQGTGLGLAIIGRMIEQMGGSISVSSVVGKGSIFTVTLNDVVYDMKKKPKEIAKLPLLEKSIAMKTDSFILLVDDVTMNLKVLSAIFSKIGFKTDLAESGQEALEKLKNQNYDYIFTDLWMPEMNGFDLAKTIREQYPKSVIIAVTADVEIQNINKDSNFDHVLIKPVTAEQLIKLLQ